MKTPALFLTPLLAFGSFAHAEIWMPSIFSDSMVLQREQPVVLWGEAAPGARVQVVLSGGEPGTLLSSTTAGDDGKWQLSLAAQDASIDRALTVVSDGDAKVFSDVAFGEVWLASGQSNMEWPVDRSAGAEAIIAQAVFPGVRVAKVTSWATKDVQQDVAVEWQRMTPETVPGVTAVGYAFGLHLHQTLGVPVGIIQSAVGGTRVEAWTPGIMPEMSEEDWKANERQQHIPSSLYNGKINGLIPYTIQGAIWYQGESNHAESDYADKLERMVTSWREKWGAEFPFYFVQIMPFKYGEEDKEILPRFWVQNSEAEQRIPKAAMLVSGDVGNVDDIHPTEKNVVGRRLASIALSKDYGRNDLVPSSGPRFAKLERTGAEVRVEFDHANGLSTRDGNAPDHWEVRNAEGAWSAANARIDGKSVIVTSESVKEPSAVRLGWDKMVVPNLVNAAGWPTATFVAELPAPPAPPKEEAAAEPEKAPEKPAAPKEETTEKPDAPKEEASEKPDAPKEEAAEKPEQPAAPEEGKPETASPEPPAAG